MRIKLLFWFVSIYFFVCGSDQSITTQRLAMIIHALQEHAYRPCVKSEIEREFGRRVEDIIEGVTAFYNDHGQLQSFELEDKGQCIEGIDDTKSFVHIHAKRFQIIRANGILHFCMLDPFFK